jgi:hypothetical protein
METTATKRRAERENETPELIPGCRRQKRTPEAHREEPAAGGLGGQEVPRLRPSHAERLTRSGIRP